MRRSPLFTGGLFALAAAAAFGATMPLIQRLGRGVGPFTTAALLYAGAALFAANIRSRHASPLRTSDVKRLLFVALLGAVVAPVALSWGLARTDGVTASLLLNLEALFTVLLAWAVWHEPLGGRVAAAVASMVVGGTVLVLHGRAAAPSLGTGGAGALAVVGATLAWAVDNVAGRPLADRDPGSVVFAKAAIGAGLSFGLSRVLAERAPAWAAGLGLLGCGAVGFGASLGLYLRAQRAIGAARTGSIFATAPFLGAAVAWTMGEGAGGVSTLFAAALCAVGVALHLTESHAHAHAHRALEHEHAHRHDDGHHDHDHADGIPSHEHAHAHRHERMAHSHPHGPDVHHRHGH